MNTKLMHIMTIGCQMNVYDSGQIRAILLSNGYSETERMEVADLVIVNTCAIRQKAEQKAMSFLGRMAKLKSKKPSLIVAVGGCVAQQHGSDILKRMPYVDLVFGTNAIFRLAEVINRVESSRCRIVDIDVHFDKKSDGKDYFFVNADTPKKVSSFVTIMRGCNNYCTYCVVPYVRGKEVSRDPHLIVEEVEMLVASGGKEVVLLGQNVNSYGKEEGIETFVQLITKIHEIYNLERIRFTTSHPKDLSVDLMDAFCNLDKLCSHIHLPVQSGNNTILKRMNRKYTRENYIDKVRELRFKCPDISVTSDFIVGFPGESNKQFESTLDLINKIQFDASFAFSYSDRSNAAASKFTDKILEKVKRERLHELLNLQDSIALRKNRSMIGSIEKILIEGVCRMREIDNDVRCSDFRESKSHSTCLFGRTSTNKVVYFEPRAGSNSENIKGKIVNVCITEAKPHSLRGRLLNNDLNVRVSTV